MAVVQYTYTHKQYRERHTTTHRTTQKLGRMGAVPRFCGFYPGICLTTEEKARKNLSQVRTLPLWKQQLISKCWESGQELENRMYLTLPTNNPQLLAYPSCSLVTIFADLMQLWLWQQMKRNKYTGNLVQQFYILLPFCVKFMNCVENYVSSVMSG